MSASDWKRLSIENLQKRASSTAKNVTPLSPTARVQSVPANRPSTDRDTWKTTSTIEDEVCLAAMHLGTETPLYGAHTPGPSGQSSFSMPCSLLGRVRHTQSGRPNGRDIQRRLLACNQPFQTLVRDGNGPCVSPQSHCGRGPPRPSTLGPSLGSRLFCLRLRSRSGRGYHPCNQCDPWLHIVSPLSTKAPQSTQPPHQQGVQKNP